MPAMLAARSRIPLRWKTVAAALEMTDPADTLVMVTADHSHTFAISGYPGRGNPILGAAAFGGEPLKAKDGKGYTTLGYANGPGAEVDGPRSDPLGTDTTTLDYRQPALVPLTPINRTSSRVVGAFSQRDMVGGLARPTEPSGSLPSASLNPGSWRNVSRSHASSYPHAIVSIRAFMMSVSSCLTRL